MSYFPNHPIESQATTDMKNRRAQAAAAARDKLLSNCYWNRIDFCFDVVVLQGTTDDEPRKPTGDWMIVLDLYSGEVTARFRGHQKLIIEMEDILSAVSEFYADMW